jgi:hypothetical protein
MSTHSTQNAGAARLPDVVPFELTHATQLSWELGTRVVDDEEATVHSSWEHGTTAWTLTIHDVTSNTVVFCLRTPVDRERFYGATNGEAESALDALGEDASWQRTN